MAKLKTTSINGDLSVTGKITGTFGGLTASRALVTNSSGNITASAVTSTELGYLDGVTSAIQTQLNGKAASSHGTHVSYGTSAKALGTSSAGSASTVSRSDHVHALPALTSCTGTLTVAKGGTGATTASKARTNLNFIGAQPISSISNDTVQKWGGLGSGCAFIHTSSTINSQPNQYGMILNVTNGETEVHQLWMTQPSGDIYHRGANASGWGAHWTKLLDASNYSSYCAPASHSHSYAASSHSHSLSSLGAKFTTIVANGSAATSASWTNNAFDFLIGCVRPASSNTPACFSIATNHCADVQVTDEVQCTVWSTTGTGMTRKSGSGTIFGLWGVNVV